MECHICVQPFDDEGNKPIVGLCGHTVCFACCTALENNCPFCKKRDAFKDRIINFLFIEKMEIFCGQQVKCDGMERENKKLKKKLSQLEVQLIKVRFEYSSLEKEMIRMKNELKEIQEDPRNSWVNNNRANTVFSIEQENVLPSFVLNETQQRDEISPYLSIKLLDFEKACDCAVVQTVLYNELLEKLELTGIEMSEILLKLGERSEELIGQGRCDLLCSSDIRNFWKPLISKLREEMYPILETVEYLDVRVKEMYATETRPSTSRSDNNLPMHFKQTTTLL